MSGKLGWGKPVLMPDFLYRPSVARSTASLGGDVPLSSVSPLPYFIFFSFLPLWIIPLVGFISFSPQILSPIVGLADKLLRR